MCLLAGRLITVIVGHKLNRGCVVFWTHRLWLEDLHKMDRPLNWNYCELTDSFDPNKMLEN